MKKSEKKKVKKDGFFHGVKVELSKVKWPTFSEMVKYTLATVIFCVLLALFFEGVSLLAIYVSELIKGLL